MGEGAEQLRRDVSPDEPPSSSPGETPSAPASSRHPLARFATAMALAALPLASLVVFGRGIEFRFTAAAYVPLHTFLELSTVVAFFATFCVQWYAAGARGLQDARARLLGMAFLGVAVMATLHIVAFPGMPGFVRPASTGRGIYYWLAERIWLVVALVTAALPRPRSRPFPRREPLFLATATLAGAIVAVDLAFPSVDTLLFVPGEGLTPLKQAIEALVAAAAAVGAWLYWQRYRKTSDRSIQKLCAALILTVLCELSVMLYSSAYDAFNLLGHLYSAVAAYLVFDALFVAALLRPYAELGATSLRLAASNAELVQLRDHVEGELQHTLRRLEEIAREANRARAEMETVIAAVPDALVVYAPDASVVRLNTAAERILGYSEAVRRAPAEERWELLRPQSPDGKVLPLEQHPAVRALRGETVTGMVHVLHPPGRPPQWVRASAAPVRGEGGAVVAAVVTMADINILQELEAQREDLLRAISHDLRNPLQVILLQAERLQRLLGEGPLSRERKSAETIAVTTRLMSTMIRDLVEMARLESGKVRLARQPVAVRELIGGLMARGGVSDPGRVAVELPPDLPRVSADPARLERVLQNLLENALRYSPPDSPVRVTATAREGAVRVAVSDRGRGIEPENVALIFERFYRGPSSQPTDGLGVGLAIARLLVEAHGGHIFVESRPGEGSTFTVTLPFAAS